MPARGPTSIHEDTALVTPTSPHRPERTRRRGGEALRAVAMATVPTAVYVAVVLRNMTYAWDDFVQFGVALRAGIGRELLAFSLFEHLGPTNRLVHGLLVLHGGLDARWALLVAVPVFFAYCLALVDLARVLGAGWGRVALCLAVATVTPATVFVGAFLDPYLHVMVPVAASAVALAAYVRWVRARRAVHAVVGALAVLVACSVQERGIFILLLLVLARVLVIDGGVVPGRWMAGWVRTWLRDLPFLAVPAGLAIGTAAVVALEYAVDAPRGGLLESAVFVARTWVVQFVPMATGAYGVGAGAGRTIVLVVVNLAVVALLVWSVRRSAWNVRPWLLLLGWFTAMMAFVGLGRLGLAPAEFIGADPNYYAYSLPALVTLIATLRADVPADRPGARGPTSRRSGVLQTGAALVVGTLVVISTLPVSERHERLAPDYLDAAVSDVLAANGRSTPAVVAPTLVPNDLVPGQFFPYNTGELVLREIDDRTVVDIDPTAALFLAADGRLTPAWAERLAREEPGAAGAATTTGAGTVETRRGNLCLSADGEGRLTVPLTSPVAVPTEALWVRIVAGSGSGRGTVATSAGGGIALGSTAPLTSAAGSTSFMVPTGAVEQIEIVEMTADQLCLEAIEVWALAAVGDEGCGWVGPYGRVSAPADGAPVCS